MKLYNENDINDKSDNNILINSINYMPNLDQTRNISVERFSENINVDSIISKYPDLYSETPSVTNVLEHIIK